MKDKFEFSKKSSTGYHYLMIPFIKAYLRDNDLRNMAHFMRHYSDTFREKTGTSMLIYAVNNSSEATVHFIAQCITEYSLYDEIIARDTNGLTAFDYAKLHDGERESSKLDILETAKYDLDNREVFFID